MASWVFNHGIKSLCGGAMDWDTDTFKVALITAVTGVSDAQDEGPNVADLDGAAAGGFTAELDLTAYGYVKGHDGAGRKAITSASSGDDIYIDTTNNNILLRGAKVSWSALGNPASPQLVVAAVIFKVGTSNDADAKVLAYIDLPDTSVNGSDLEIVWATDSDSSQAETIVKFNNTTAA